jgi:hypothetical protein
MTSCFGVSDKAEVLRIHLLRIHLPRTRVNSRPQEAPSSDAATLPELEAYLAQLDKICKSAERELEVLRSRKEHVRAL